MKELRRFHYGIDERKKIGYGCMRLPLLNKEDQTSFDYELINKLFNTYLEKGFTYFDTAYTYHAEEAMRKAFVERYQCHQLNDYSARELELTLITLKY
jgi:predicted aldo/keto reductase-like oxidoreductase